ncbi:MAG: FAD-dependent oxidoreductase [Pseudomonadota bacterium]
MPSGSQAAAFYAVRTLTDATIPTNGGCFRPVRLVLPEASVVNPVEPAPVNGRGSTIKRIAGACIGALAQAMPDRVPASSAGELLVMAFGGKRPDGSRYVVGDLVAGGSGAATGADGVDVIETDATNCMNLPAEALEMEAPIRLNCVEIRRDSGGAGEFRGGLGVRREYEMLADEVAFSHRGERHLVAAQGLAGGQPGEFARSVIHRAAGGTETIRSKIVTTLLRGDRLVVETAGGGGVGEAKQRPAAAVTEDLRNGKIGPDAARTVYGPALMAAPTPPSYWEFSANARPALAPPAGDASHDVAIIGGGFTGLSAAHHLTQAGIGCVVLEANRVGWGASGRNGGMAVTRFKKGWSALAAAYGTDATIALPWHDPRGVRYARGNGPPPIGSMRLRSLGPSHAGARQGGARGAGCRQSPGWRPTPATACPDCSIAGRPPPSSAPTAISAPISTPARAASIR